MTETDRRCRTCGMPLAEDNIDGRCGSCQSRERGVHPAPPTVPPEFWDDRGMQDALRTRHMGKVIRAYRQHRYHGYRGLSQTDIANWAFTTQGHVSRLENGRQPLRDLDRLIYWARLLGIPQRHLWFELPENAPMGPPTPAGLQGPAAGDHPTPVRWLQQATTAAPTGRETDLTAAPGGAEPEPASAPAGAKPDLTPTSGDAEKDLTPTLPNPPISIDINTAQPARMGDYLLGGGANFSVDREVTDYLTRPLPGGTATARTVVQATSDFQDRVVRYLARDQGIRQYLNFRTRLPTGPRVHEIAQQVAPDSRVVYVFDDDVSLAHAHRLGTGVPAEPGQVTYVRGQLHATEKLLQQVARLLDFEQPIGLLVFGALVAIDDDSIAHSTIRQLLDAVVSGSYLVITHITGDILGPAASEPAKRLKEMIAEGKLLPMTLRTKDDILRFLDGVGLVGPGVVPVDQWYSNASPAPTNESTTFIYGAVGRKP